MRLPPWLVIATITLCAPSEALADPPGDQWRDATIESTSGAREEPPHPEAPHEWWFFTVQNPDAGSGCGPWQAMVTFLADREVASDRLLLTTVVDGVATDHSLEFNPGTLQRDWDAYEQTTTLVLDDQSSAAGKPGAWSLRAASGDVVLDLQLEADPSRGWTRQAPEGAGRLGITFVPRAIAHGSLRIGERVCTVTGSGYYEHVWGTWSRVPMWGVDYLNAHLDDGWSVYARRTLMRGASNVYPALGQDPDEFFPPVLILSDGTRTIEATDVTFEVEDATALDPQLGIPLPARYTVRGYASLCALCDSAPMLVELRVTDPVLATIFLATTSSGILEGWGAADLTIGTTTRHGTSEVEMQRYGTRYPH